MRNRMKSLIAGTLLGWFVLLASTQAVFAQFKFL